MQGMFIVKFKKNVTSNTQYSVTEVKLKHLKRKNKKVKFSNSVHVYPYEAAWESLLFDFDICYNFDETFFLIFANVDFCLFNNYFYFFCIL